MNQDSFFSRPEHEVCRAGLKGCTQVPTVRLHCQTEGSDVDVCDNCARVWRENAQAQSLYERCPRCASWRPGTRASPSSPASQIMLTGAAAEVINRAMHAEGLLLDVRHLVLIRLNREAPWLNTAMPGNMIPDERPVTSGSLWP